MKSAGKVIGIGESVLDIVFKGIHPQSANPGGSAFNAAIALGRCGIPCCFLTEMGDDLVSDYVAGFMEENGVDAQYVIHIPETKSRISLAFLDERNEAHYQFYRDPEPDNLVYHLPEIGAEDLVLISSFYAVNPAIRYRVQPFLKQARQAGALIYYDVNFRSSHAGSLPAVWPGIEENFQLATLVRGSIDDFNVIYKVTDPDVIYEKYVKPYCSLLILTDGPNAVQVYTPDVRLKLEAPVLQTVSTIGAGDNFNAGVLYYLFKHGITAGQLSSLSAAQWKALIAQAEEFAVEVCQSIENYISRKFGESKK